MTHNAILHIRKQIKITAFGNIDENGAVYYARYSSVTNKYTITWKNGELTLFTDSNASYGTMPTFRGENPTKAQTNKNFYVFDGWSPSVSQVVGNVTYTAIFKEKSKTISTPEISPDDNEDIQAEVSRDE